MRLGNSTAFVSSAKLLLTWSPRHDFQTPVCDSNHDGDDNGDVDGECVDDGDDDDTEQDNDTENENDDDNDKS